MATFKKLLFGLFTESVPEEPGIRKLSIGRLFLFVVFVHSMVVWGFSREIPSGEQETMWALMAYVFGTKLVDGIKALRAPK